MRETCARVLAAALMTGAIAFALGAPALFESTREESRLLKAPPSSLQRSVRVAALPAPARPHRAERLPARSVSRPVRQPAVVDTAPRSGIRRTPQPSPKASGSA